MTTPPIRPTPINVLTHSVHDLYSSIQTPRHITRIDPDYHRIHEKADQFAFLLLKHLRERKPTEHLQLVPFVDYMPESILTLLDEKSTYKNRLLAGLDAEQRELVGHIEEIESLMEWEMTKECYANGIVNGMIRLAKMIPPIQEKG